MGFKEDIQKLSVQIIERRKHIANEEMTKQSLVIPFFQTLGFDVFDPREVRPEYMSDFGKKRGEKVDYALFKDGTPIMFVEVKPAMDELVSHDAQLSRYFNATPEVRLGILTNGVVYKFFTDLSANNIMDTTPFMVIDLTALNDTTIEAIATFRKEAFETEKILIYAEETIYTASLNAKIKDVLKNPPDDFIRYLIKDFSDTRITSNVVARFKPLVKKAISNAILDIVSKGLLTQNEQEQVQVSEQEGNQSQQNAKAAELDKTEDALKGPVTTAEELRSMEIVRMILTNAKKDVSQLSAKDTHAYYAIYNRVITEWFLRVNVNSANKHILCMVPVETATLLAPDFKVEPAPKGWGESRIYIKSVEDLMTLNKLVVQAFAQVAH